MAIIGSGVVGLAAVGAIAARGRSACVIERHPQVGLDASTHNTGVIHAGIYYPQGSLKARLCAEGREQLYRFCEDHAIPHERCGKLIVASQDGDVARLESLAANGRANGVDDLVLVDPSFIRTREPHVAAAAAIWSPSTGIVEAEALVRALARTAEDRGAYLLPGTPVDGSTAGAEGLELHTPRETIVARVAVNAAGLYADAVAATLGGERFTIYPVRGDYAELVPSARFLINGPVYPLPDASGHSLGFHFTRTTWNTVTLGPTARYQSSKDDYEGDRLPPEVFFEAARRLLPSITPSDLRPGGSGIRATTCPPEQPFTDFLIRRDAHLRTLIHAAGIDSPGLTACLAIGRMVADLVEDTLR